MAVNSNYFNYQPQSTDLSDKQMMSDYQVQNDIKKMSIDQAYAIEKMEKQAALEAKLIAMREGNLSPHDAEILMNEGVAPQQVQAMVQHSEAVRTGQITKDEADISFQSIAGNILGGAAGWTVGKRFGPSMKDVGAKASPYVKKGVDTAAHLGNKGMEAALKNAYVQRAGLGAMDGIEKLMGTKAGQMAGNAGRTAYAQSLMGLNKIAGSGAAKFGGKMLGKVAGTALGGPVGLILGSLAGEAIGRALNSDDKEKARQAYMQNMFGNY